VARGRRGRCRWWFDQDSRADYRRGERRNSTAGNHCSKIAPVGGWARIVDCARCAMHGIALRDRCDVLHCPLVACEPPSPTPIPQTARTRSRCAKWVLESALRPPDPAPGVRTDGPLHLRASIRRFELAAIAAAPVSIWRILIAYRSIWRPLPLSRSKHPFRERRPLHDRRARLAKERAAYLGVWFRMSEPSRSPTKRNRFRYALTSAMTVGAAKSIKNARRILENTGNQTLGKEPAAVILCAAPR
jgi:hypothetical protein